MESHAKKSKWRSEQSSRGFARVYPFWPLIAPYRSQYLRGCGALVGTDAINVALPLVVKAAIDSLEGRSLHGVFLAAGIYAGLMTLQAWGRYLWRVYLIGTSYRVATDLRAYVFGRLQRTALFALQKQPSGDLLARATQDVEAVRVAVGPGVLVAFDATLMLVLLLPPMFWLSPKLALLSLAFLPVAPVLTYFLGGRIDRQFGKMQERFSAMGALAQESFGAVRFLKGWCLERSAVRRFIVESRGYEKEGVSLARVEAPFSPTLGLFVNLGTVLLLFYGGKDVWSGAMTIGTFVAFQRFLVQLSWPMEAIGWMVTMHREAAAAHRRLDAVSELPEAERVIPGSPVPPTRSDAPVLEIEKLRFAFPTETFEASFRLELDDLRVERGQRIAIVGPVGSGKTTLFRVLLRLYPLPESAGVRLEGVPLDRWPVAELRRRLALAEQTPVVFGENLRDNVELGLTQRPSDAEFARLAAVASLEGSLLQRGEESLAERAGDFSGGQRQRVALFRALVRKPSLLLLDDALSAVDEVVEGAIFRKLLDERLPVLFATHRLAALPAFDEVWVFDRGRVVGRGPHHQLLRGNALYRTLWDEARERAAESAARLHAEARA